MFKIGWLVINGLVMILAPAIAHPTAIAKLEIVVDKARKGESPTAQTMSVYVDHVLVHKYFVSTGMEEPIVTSSGQPSDRVTPVGVFKIYDREIDYVSKTWTGAKMPYAQFFYRGAAIHASESYASFGERDSGGCIRLHPANAKILWDLVSKYGVSNTVILIFDGRVSPFPDL